MNIYRVCGRYVAMLRARNVYKGYAKHKKEEGGYMATGKTRIEAIIKCFNNAGIQ